MAFPIGFTAERPPEEPAQRAVSQPPAARPSVVQVHFDKRNMTLAYYNDRFDLHPGDLVYVDGKLEGLRGRVMEVNCNFKIRISDYKRVIAVADTQIHGTFYTAGAYFVTFQETVLPPAQAALWFKAPPRPEDEFASGSDGASFSLKDLQGLQVSAGVAQRGREYYLEDRVRYLSLRRGEGFAIVEGSQTYEVEFRYEAGEIGGLTCSCYCSYHCKHQVAVLLQLRELLAFLEKHYAGEYEKTSCFSAMEKATLLELAVLDRETGSITL